MAYSTPSCLRRCTCLLHLPSSTSLPYPFALRPFPRSHRQQALALTFNLDITDPLGASIANLYYDCGGSTPFSGLTVSQILAAANDALGQKILLGGLKYSDYNKVLTDLNESYDDCKPAGAAAVLLKSSCDA